MGGKAKVVVLPTSKAIKILKWKVKEGSVISVGRILLYYDINSNFNSRIQLKLKSTNVGTVRKLLAKEGELVHPGEGLLELEECTHPTVMKDMCAECGADLRQGDQTLLHASVPMVHSIPELKVSHEQAQLLGKADEERLLQDRKLVLLVDLDQTLIHTTNDNIPANLKDVYHFQLYGPQSPWYHTRLRPGTHKFLREVSKYYELHICTFGARNYAHMIALFLDPDGTYFSHRILSRDECFNPFSKTANLKALFPCGDNMVCIIDDREDVWNYAPNLIHVKPYHFFQHTGDINAPPGLAKQEEDEITGFDFSKLGSEEKKAVSPATEVNGKPEPKEDVQKAAAEEAEEPSQANGVSGDGEAERSDAEDRCGGAGGDLDVSDDEGKDDGVEKKSGEVVDETAGRSGEAECGDSPLEREKGVDRNGGDQEAAAAGTGGEETKQGAADEDDLIEVEDGDDYLLYLEEILKNVHSEFYRLRVESSVENPDLKTIIPDVRSKVLAGTSLVLSGLVPTHVTLEKSRPFLVARSLGAEVTTDVTPRTTHLVAVRPGTAKVNSARRARKVRVVTADWLWSCAERWERVDERLFPLNRKGLARRHPPPHCVSPELRSSSGRPAARQRTPSGRFMDTINPLMSFSPEDIANMDREVEDIFNESGSDGNDAETEVLAPASAPAELRDDPDSSTDSSDSLAEHPRGWRTPVGRKRPAREMATESDDEEEESPSAKFRRGEALPSDLDLGTEENSEGSEGPLDSGDDGEWNMMGAALEREFLSGSD
ncbi:RNA polymerase II subunit A C-terminal domain phosphatase isoform X2 [Bacillus rossius redtenbacheri]|uniref:RNA polymerase II subunit A C-terminal domain phosphatase isoform X2 n=1 Tax=Bacillus rossius redtenbacheri TaxID=93214 RepID=UPI002FDD51D8